MQRNLRTITLTDSEPSQYNGAQGVIGGTPGDQLTIMIDDELSDGEQYGYCLHGVASGGAYYEGDDVFGFGAEPEAEAAGRSAYESGGM